MLVAEDNVQMYQLEQDGRVYRLNTSLVGPEEDLKLVCYEVTPNGEGARWEQAFTIYDLRTVNPIFNFTPTCEDAQIEIERSILEQNCGVRDTDDFLSLILYMRFKERRAKAIFRLRCVVPRRHLRIRQVNEVVNVVQAVEEPVVVDPQPVVEQKTIIPPKPRRIIPPKPIIQPIVRPKPIIQPIVEPEPIVQPIVEPIIEEPQGCQLHGIHNPDRVSTLEAEARIIKGEQRQMRREINALLGASASRVVPPPIISEPPMDLL